MYAVDQLKQCAHIYLQKAAGAADNEMVKDWNYTCTIYNYRLMSV